MEKSHIRFFRNLACVHFHISSNSSRCKILSFTYFSSVQGMPIWSIKCTMLYQSMEEPKRLAVSNHGACAGLVCSQRAWKKTELSTYFYLLHISCAMRYFHLFRVHRYPNCNTELVLIRFFNEILTRPHWPTKRISKISLWRISGQVFPVPAHIMLDWSVNSIHLKIAYS